MPKKILVAVELDDDPLLTDILETAKHLAASDGGTLSLVSVVSGAQREVSAYLPNDFKSKATADAKRDLEKLVSDFALADLNTTTLVRFGSIYEEILMVAEELGADLIVIGCHKLGLSDFLLGPNAARVVRHAKCSVYVVR